MSELPSTDDKLNAAIRLLTPFLRRGQCVEVLLMAGLSERKIKDGMALLQKHFPLGCIRARYRRHEFLAAFKLLPQPGASNS